MFSVFTTRSARAVVPIALVVMGLGQAPATASGRGSSVVTARVNLTDSLGGLGRCPVAAANAPQIVAGKNPLELRAVYLLGAADAMVAAKSFNGGRTWSHSLVPGVTECSGGPDGSLGNPFLAVGAAGRIVTTSSWVTNDESHVGPHDNLHLFVSRSDDGGSSFAGPVEPELSGSNQRGPLSFAPGSNDDLLVTFARLRYVNVGPADPYRSYTPLGVGSTYVPGGGGSVAVARSHDGGKTFLEPPSEVITTTPGTDVVTVGLTHSGTTAVLIVATIDTVQLLHAKLTGEAVKQTLLAFRSDDGGTTWSGPATVGQTATHACCIPDVTSGPDGAVYVAWPDPESHGVVLAKSTDAGQTWSTQHAFTSSEEIMQPGIAVNPEGKLGVFLYEKAAGSSNVTPVVTTSSDGGATWERTMLEEQFDVDSIEDGSWDGTSLGPYQDIVGLPHGFGVTATVGDGAKGSDVWYFMVNQPSTSRH